MPRAHPSEVQFWWFDFENRYPYSSLSEWCYYRPHYPVIAVTLYLAMIHFGQQTMAARPAMRVKWPLVLWNSGLALFSAFACFRSVNYTLHNAIGEKWNWQRILCHDDPDNVSGYMVFLIVMSKFAELGDTVFLIVRKKPIIFLHWYHHVTVLLYAWIAAVADAPVAKFFILFNVSVHSVMYTYFAAQSLGFRAPRLVSISITLFQISQMVAGIVSLSLSFHYSQTSSDCRSPTVTLIAGTLMYGSYFVLFVDFFLKAYLRQGHKAIGTRGGNKVD